MTREEIIEQLNLAIGLIKQDGKDWLDDRDIPMLEECVKALEQEPCDYAQERYEDLCEYFGDAKDILKSRKDFKAWLERIKWHIHKAEELYEKYEHKQEPCDKCVYSTKDGYCQYDDIAETIPPLEPCDDVVSRQAVLDINESHHGQMPNNINHQIWQEIKDLPSVRPQEQTGHWIYTGDYITDGMLRCSECGFEHDVSERFRFCPNCRARMESEVRT